ncbi:LysR family transcriptional regulator [Arthrobacter sp. PAMC25564]|uniref:LysR family transcriptional regulator n=1 Tax=Arthrobacter sp. PAMC25564 TaxID=2565366 RepID=UPI0010A25A18|nr:LysR family transcriptional regulator [Arthrobacter sp. PAMC25564]QCB96414.1 LysR family transcriptional regulator [Arthrobacter sp. PAMC25564]
MSLDLNLIRTFLSIYDHRSVTRAAQDLSLTQPTVSHALGRLRRALRDPLFVRGPVGYEPTARASELAAVFRKAVVAVDDAVDADRAFDPSSTDRTFRLCLSDIGEHAFLPRIMKRFVVQAPGASLEVVPMQISQVQGWLAHGEIDGAIASVPLDVSGRRTIVADDHYVCVLPREAASPGPRISWQDFLALKHVAMDPAAGHDQVERAVRAQQVEREIALRVPHFSALAEVVAGCGMAAIVPLQMATRMAERWPVAIRELPFDTPEFEVTLYWDAAISSLGAAAWFLDLVAEALGGPGD